MPYEPLMRWENEGGATLPAGDAGRSPSRSSQVPLRIETADRWDALALVARLPRYRWHLVQTDARHWFVCLSVGMESESIPEDLVASIREWLAERRLDAATVHALGRDHVISAA